MSVTPARVLKAANGMNFALLRTVSRFLGEPWMLRPYRRTPYERIGRDLLDIYEARQPADLPGFTDVSLRWAELLDVGDWFSLVHASSLPSTVKRAWD